MDERETNFYHSQENRVALNWFTAKSMIQTTQIAMDVYWERHDEQGRESMILCNSRRQTDGAIYHTDRLSDPPTDRHWDRQTDRLTHRQTDRHTDIQTWKQNRSVQIISDAMQRSQWIARAIFYSVLIIHWVLNTRHSQIQNLRKVGIFENNGRHTSQWR